MSQQPPVNPYATAPAPLRPEDEKLWATLIHVGGIFFGGGCLDPTTGPR